MFFTHAKCHENMLSSRSLVLGSPRAEHITQSDKVNKITASQ